MVGEKIILIPPVKLRRMSGHLCVLQNRKILRNHGSTGETTDSCCGLFEEHGESPEIQNREESWQT